MLLMVEVVVVLMIVMTKEGFGGKTLKHPGMSQHVGKCAQGRACPTVVNAGVLCSMRHSHSAELLLGLPPLEI